MAKSKRPKRVRRVEIHWFDIEEGTGWGDGADEPPVVVQIGYLHSRPKKNQKIPSWKIKNSQVEEEPGGVSIIPVANVLNIEYLGWVDVPWRD